MEYTPRRVGSAVLVLALAISVMTGLWLAPASAKPGQAQFVASGQWAGAEVQRVGEYMAFVQWADAMNAITGYVGAVIAAQEAEAAAAAAAAQAAAQRAAQARTAPQVAPTVAAGPGYPSEAFWHKVAVCEEGGNNDPRYGFFGKIDGAWAGLSWDEQVARARDLWNSTIAAGRDITKVWTSYPSCTGPVF